MSSTRRRKPRRPRRTGVSRRDFLKHAGAIGAVVAAAPLLPACGGSGGGGGGSSSDDGLPPNTSPVSFGHGVASGDPLSDRVILWTRVTPQVPGGSVTVNYVVARDAALSQVVRQGSLLTGPNADYTVKVDPTGLSPGTVYYYRFNVGAVQSPVGRTRTLPVGAVDHLRFAVASCASLAHGFFNAYGALAARDADDLDAVLFLGDYIYEYPSGEYGDAREYEPAGEILTLQDYRTRYAQYRREPELQALHQKFPMIVVWDDHETADNSWTGGAVNHTPGTEGEWCERKAIGVRVFFEWLPVRPAGDNPMACETQRIYRNFQYGDLVNLVMLDTRLEGRVEQVGAALGGVTEPLPSPISSLEPFIEAEVSDPGRTLISAAQETWLLQQLQTSARWRLIGQQVMFGQLKVLGAPNALGTSLFLNPDQWDGYPVARQRIIDFIRGNGVDNTVFLTGDIHTSWAMDISDDPNNPLAYNPVNGSGSLAVEFVCTSVTSPGFEQIEAVQDAVRVSNPHMKFVDLARHGYVVLDITPARLNTEFWFVDSIAERNLGQSLAASFTVQDGANRIDAALLPV